jgi:hypothetical protein
MKKRLPTAALLALCVLGWVLAPAAGKSPAAGKDLPAVIDREGLRGKVLCGYQGWFRCPGDAANLGWIHWSRDSRRIAPETLTIEMWPDLGEFPAEERYPAPGFTCPDGRQAELFSSDNAGTVLRHFQWMREYGLDGAWLQHFLVDLPGGPGEARYPTRLRVLQHVRQAARQTGRVWALSYDIAGMPQDAIFQVLTTDWKKRVDEGITQDPRYLHDGGRPVVQVWGFYHGSATNLMTADLAGRLAAFFHAPGRYAAFLVGGGDWNWRGNPDPEWQAALRRLDAYVPWNVGNYSVASGGVKRATTNYWAEDKRECERRGVLWIPSVYPGFSWDNLKQQPPGTSTIPRRRGEFLWEQFHALAGMGGDSACVAMFDEVDEGTAIFKVTSAPPVQAHFAGYEGLPSDWYLRLVREGIRMLRGQRPITPEMPIKP